MNNMSTFKPPYDDLVDKRNPPAGDACLRVDLDSAKPSARYGMPELEHFVEEIEEDDAVFEINYALGNRGLVVFDDGLPLEAVQLMATTCAFVADAAGAVPPKKDTIAIAKSVFESRCPHGLGCARAVPVADLCYEPALPDAMGPLVRLSDFTVDTSSVVLLGYPYVEYVGDIPQPLLDAIGVDDVQDAIVHSYFDVLGADERMDVPDGFDVLSAMTFGARSLDQSFFDWNGRAQGRYASFVSSCVYGEEDYKRLDGYAPYRGICDDLKDLSLIWKSMQEEHNVGVRVAASKKDSGKLPDPESLRRAMETVAELVGISAAVRAYLSGVPAADVLA